MSLPKLCEGWSHYAHSDEILDRPVELEAGRFSLERGRARQRTVSMLPFLSKQLQPVLVEVRHRQLIVFKIEQGESAETDLLTVLRRISTSLIGEHRRWQPSMLPPKLNGHPAVADAAGAHLGTARREGGVTGKAMLVPPEPEGNAAQEGLQLLTDFGVISVIKGAEPLVVAEEDDRALSSGSRKTTRLSQVMLASSSLVVSPKMNGRSFLKPRVQ